MVVPLPVKFIIAVIWDFLDFTIGRIPVFGTMFDILGMVVALMLWGPLGIVALWEVIDITDQFDAEVPTVTLIGIISVLGGRK